MFKCTELPGKTFASKEDMFHALAKDQKRIIELKQAQIYKSCEKGQFSYLNLEVSKMTGAAKAGFDIKEGYIYPVISTTGYMDSHKDVHFPGCFAKTAKEQQGKVYYALDHELKWNSIIAWQKDVNMFVAPLDWSLVGKNYFGQTEGLVFEIPKDKINIPSVLNAIENKTSEFENSIRMVYYKMHLGINSNSKDLKENKAYFDSRINDIANKEEAYKEDYFWGIEELGIRKEGSLVVAGGSNDATRILTADNSIDPEQSSQEEKAGPPESSQKVKSLFHNLI